MADHKVFTVTMPGGTLRVTVYNDDLYELPCMACDEPMLIGKDDHFNVVEDQDGKPVAFLCQVCAKKAMERLKQ